MSREKYVLVGLISIVFLIIIPLLFSTFLIKKFKVQEFEEEVTINLNSDFTPLSGKVCYGNIINCENPNVTQEGTVDKNTPGEYKIIYHYTIDSHEFTKEQIVNVVDKTPPSIEVLEENLFYCENGNVKAYKAKAIDNYDGDISDKITRKIENGNIIFSVTDSFGNGISVSKKGILKDIEKPEIKVNGGEIVYIKLNDNYQEEGAEAYDNCDGNITDKIEITGNVDTKKEGIYEITYKIKDKSGNENTTTKEVIVYKEENKDGITNTKKQVYLTFDDGPGKYTNELLDILKKYNVKATFFVTNQPLTTGYDDIILRAYKEGHTIGLHSDSHDYKIYTNKETYFNDLYKIQEKVKRITGSESFIIRFPGGSSNTISKNYDNNSHIMSELSKAVEEKGFIYYDWNIVSGDAGETKDTNEIITNVISNLGKFETSMILQHDIKDYSIKAVPSIIEYGLTHGYEFLPITKDTPKIQHHINN